jgi:hypothetical protein
MMSLPSEYVIEDVVRSIDDIIVYRANHPIHGIVNAYLPDDTLPPELARPVRKRLYQNGLQMRSISLLDIPFVTKALEVSQNPHEPYIVTRHTEHDLDEFISNGAIIKPKRMFEILSQTLRAKVNLAANGWVTARFHPRQIKLSQLAVGDISFTAFEGTEQQIAFPNNTTVTPEGKPGEAIERTAPRANTNEDTVGTAAGTTPKNAEVQEPQQIKATRETGEDFRPTRTATEGRQTQDSRKQLMATRRNIYALGNITYQLLFGRKYEVNDTVAIANVNKLARRWRKILEKALSQNIDSRYDGYETLLADVTRALNRNKRAAVASIQQASSGCFDSICACGGAYRKLCGL